jgi:hypothetical protein
MAKSPRRTPLGFATLRTAGIPIGVWSYGAIGRDHTPPSQDRAWRNGGEGQLIRQRILSNSEAVLERARTPIAGWGTRRRLDALVFTDGNRLLLADYTGSVISCDTLGKFTVRTTRSWLP